MDTLPTNLSSFKRTSELPPLISDDPLRQMTPWGGFALLTSKHTRCQPLAHGPHNEPYDWIVMAGGQVLTPLPERSHACRVCVNHARGCLQHYRQGLKRVQSQSIHNAQLTVARGYEARLVASRRFNELVTRGLAATEARVHFYQAENKRLVDNYEAACEDKDDLEG
jgi:hypothetical protein